MLRKLNIIEMNKKINTTTLNLALGLPGMCSVFTNNQLLKIRIVAVVSSSLSSCIGICAIYLLYNYDHRKKLFRHELITFLIICDFIKALILLLYPIILLIDNRAYASPSMIQTLGWFTQFATEGSDFAIGFFAIHFALLIFKPNWKWRNKKSGNIEGGLYKYRQFIWPITLLFPAIMASLAFIDYNVIDYVNLSTVNIVDYNDEYAGAFVPRRGGYKPWSAWSYLPARPLWYKYVLSWGPRYFLILMIIAIYVSIYIYVLRETKKIKEQFHPINGVNDIINEDLNKHSSFFKRRIIDPVHKALRILLLIATFNLDLSSDDSMEPERSYSANSLYAGHNSKQGSNTDNNLNQPLQPTALKKLNVKKDNNGKIISLKSFIFSDSNTADDKGNAVEYPPRENEGDITTSGNDSPVSQDCSIRKIVSKITDNRTSNSSFSTNKNETISTETKLQENPLIHNIENNDPNNTTTTSHTDDDNNTNTKQEIVSNNSSINISDLQNQLLKENYAALKKRRAQIQRNLKMIFIYPVSYILIWIFPIAADVSQTHHEMIYGPILWLTYVDTFVRPMSCLVNSCVFILRERPWRYSWKKVEEKNLIDKYMLKGEIGEEEMQKLCESKSGRHGWYYRSMWRKKHCWKHQNNSLKRCLWYVGRFFKRILTFKKIDFYDNCNDELYWSKFYYLDRDAGYPKTRIDSSSECGLCSNVSSSTSQDRNNGQRTIPQLGACHNAPFLSHNQEFNNTKASLYNSPRKELVSEVFVPWYWRMLHLLPLAGGIDLDELNRSVKLKYANNDDDFIIPGLSFAVNSDKIVEKNTTANISHNRDNSPFDEPKSERLYNSKNHVGRNSPPTTHSNNNHITSLRLNSNQPPKQSSNRLDNTPEEEGEVDLLAFLNDSSMHQ